MKRLSRSLGTAALLAVMAPLFVRADWIKDGANRQIKRFTGQTVTAKSDDSRDLRGKVTIRRIKPKCKSDWNNDPTALPYLFYQLKVRTNGEYPCYVDNEGIELTGEEIFDYPIIYFTSHYPFQFTDDEVENLKKYLARGGTLWLDDCTGSGPFMESVPLNTQRLAPGAEPKLMMGKDYADLFKMIYPMNGLPRLKENFMRPVQCWNINGRPAIIFVPNDYGCMWEVASPPNALSPLGEPAHGTSPQGREEVYRWSINWFFYSMTH